MISFKNYIFDLDGTLVNSSDEVIECMHKAFELSGEKIEKSRLSSDMIGPPLDVIIKNIAPGLSDGNKITEIMLNFRKIYDNNEKDVSTLYDGVIETLEALKRGGAKIFLATLKPDIPTRRIIKQFKIEQYFTDVYTIDKCGRNMAKTEMIEDIILKYGLKKSETVMTGDAAGDMKAAKQAGIYAIGALWGYGSDKTELIKNADITAVFVQELRG